VNLSICIVAAASLLAPQCAPAATAATVFSEKGDPARWYQPIETSRQKRDNAMTEARNALAEALRECRLGAARKACESEARIQYQRDVAHAQDFDAPARQLG
jgi:hypothetical protein